MGVLGRNPEVLVALGCAALFVGYRTGQPSHSPAGTTPLTASGSQANTAGGTATTSPTPRRHGSDGTHGGTHGGGGGNGAEVDQHEVPAGRGIGEELTPAGLRGDAEGVGWVNFTKAELEALVALPVPESEEDLAVALATAAGVGTLGSAAAHVADLAAKIRASEAGISARQRRRVAAAALLRHEVIPTTAMRELTKELRLAHGRRARSLARGRRRAPIYLLHVSKAGGTSLCSLSHYNQCAEHPKANNCWVPGAGPVWFADFGHTEATCGDYEAMVDEHGLDIIANEGYLDGGAGPGATPSLCPAFLHVTLLRHPRTRVESHLEQNGVKATGLSREEFAALPLKRKLELRPDVASNYMVRVLLGKEKYESGMDGLTTSDATAAAAVLSNFDVTLLLERKASAPALLEQTLGWWQASSMDTKHGRRRHASGLSLTAADRELLAGANELDARVYAAAETMLKLDAVLFAPPHPRGDGNTPRSPLTCGNPKRKPPPRR